MAHENREGNTRALRVALVGTGVMGAYHAVSLAQRLPGVRLAGIADVDGALAERVAASVGCGRWTTDAQTLLADPEVDAVVIATPGRFHATNIAEAAQAGKAIFCEKPLAYELDDADRALAAVAKAGVRLQIGFQRRFDRSFVEAHALAADGSLGSIQLMRSLTRDPELSRPERVPPFAVFRETMIHDFDVLNWMACGARAVDVFARAEALVRPDWKERGLLDTALVSVRYDTGAMATADVSFQSVYGYDVRAEVFGSAGMASVGDGRRGSVVHYTAAGETARRVSWFTELFGEAYVAELAHFAECVRTGAAPSVGGSEGRAALAMAVAAMRSVESGRAERVE